ncbi:MAG: hypothetical protein ACPLZA_03750 [Thermodesulfovibrio sp.]|jgi:6-phosphofructokinase|uniref:Uncharacterized protein n=2 Tax=Thermodesulfovibrio TaxID=28261 RepID=A0A2J6WGV4_9BACT|nr:MAG: hypothetical protein C0186_06450 [Thermodesulfovibrio aggregans]
MEKETSTSNLIEKFDEIANYVKEKYGANIWFVEIMGKRHSYIAGHREDSFLPSEVIYLSERYAIVSNEWEKIKEKEAVVSLCKVAINGGDC